MFNCRGGWSLGQVVQSVYLPSRNWINASRVKPASLSSDTIVPFGMSRLCWGTTALRSENLAISRGLTAGSFGILEVERCNQRFVVSRDWLFMFLETLDVAGNGVLSHFFC